MGPAVNQLVISNDNTMADLYMFIQDNVPHGDTHSAVEACEWPVA